MHPVLTTASRVTCGHPPGAVHAAGRAKLAVGGSPVLRRADLDGAAVENCGIQPASDASGPTAVKCLAVTGITAGVSSRLRVGGEPVLLDSLAGKTNGMLAKKTPQELLAATAVQDKLRAT
ncbi:hypothetical protein [Saccharopolyspora rosea]|uniref:Uncharacterized protein n=1 Tax=Saccharopolyspora rosea TaxID=524884 RepID=A0ABW3FV06_9PSEU|nr:hypothetical protein [Saccharopolyspora rosea]